jgi:hypothetical protein
VYVRDELVWWWDRGELRIEATPFPSCWLEKCWIPDGQLVIKGWHQCRVPSHLSRNVEPTAEDDLITGISRRGGRLGCVFGVLRVTSHCDVTHNSLKHTTHLPAEGLPNDSAELPDRIASQERGDILHRLAIEAFVVALRHVPQVWQSEHGGKGAERVARG